MKSMLIGMSLEVPTKLRQNFANVIDIKGLV